MPLIRAVALNIIKSLVPLNLPGSAIISHLQQLGMTYRRTDMLFDIRKAFDRVKYETQITRLSSNSVVPDSWMNSEKLGEPYNYRVHLKVDYYDPDTGEYSTEHRFMFADDIKSVGEYVEDFPDYAMSKDYVQDKSFEGASVVGITKNEREGVPF
jgi:hypothetical protein